MCGIAGIWGDCNETLVQTMMNRLAHRGPDAQGIYAKPGLAGVLGHRRLSIMDPTGGNQPLVCDWGAIVANGEIYNFPQLRRQLADQYSFSTGSDTEAALHLYREIGQETAQRLYGMFALAIADGADLYLARDCLGIKPLYWGKHQETLVFASEIKALAGLATEVQEFPPGAWFHSRLGLHRYYEVPQREPTELPLEQHLSRLQETLERAVVRRLMSDVPVGAFLSGGLDSSLIAAIARRHLDPLHTFSVGLPDSRDLAAARMVAQHLGSIHHEYSFTLAEVQENLPAILYHLESYDQDLVRSAIPCYFASRLARDWVKVILTGEGADELFAGYRYHRNYAGPGALHRELRRSVGALHNINLQRVDRMTMAHAIEGRVPFLDMEMIDLAQTIAPHLKLHRDTQGRVIEKWILRKTGERLLPSTILWREKEQFDEGSGTTEVIAQVVSRWMSPDKAKTYAQAHSAARLRSLEECVYHDLLRQSYCDPEPILSNVARWAERTVIG